MQTLLSYLKRPYTEKGLIIGTLDLLLKCLTVFVWGYVTVILCSLFFDSLLTDYNPLNKLSGFVL